MAIKAFQEEGIIGDTNLIETKERLITFKEGQMRDRGYVPVLDLEPEFTLDYVPDKEHYNFKLVVHGIYVGKEEAWLVSGMSKGKKVMRSTQPSKSSQS